MFKKINFALDYDDTYSKEPGLWNDFIYSVRKHNHSIQIVTMRYEDGFEAEEIKPIFEKMNVPIIFCNRRWKKNVCKEKGINIDIWIDDMPAAIEDQRELQIYDYTKDKVLHIWDWLTK